MAFVKIVEAFTSEKLEEKVNEVLEKYSGYIHDIKYQATHCNPENIPIVYSSMIIVSGYHK